MALRKSGSRRQPSAQLSSDSLPGQSTYTYTLLVGRNSLLVTQGKTNLPIEPFRIDRFAGKDVRVPAH